MASNYAVVSYLPDDLARFVATLRTELNPHDAHLRPHLTLLAPRLLEGSANTLESHFRAALDRVENRVEPFDVAFGAVESFAPRTFTLFLAVARGESEIRSFNARLEACLGGEAEFPFVPHLTLGRFAGQQGHDDALALCSERWKAFSGPRVFTVGEAVLVQESAANQWIDLLRLALAHRRP